jgi:hypothetical protein
MWKEAVLICINVLFQHFMAQLRVTKVIWIVFDGPVAEV